METVLQQLRGEQLSAVTFVQDYLQLDFDGAGFSIFTPVSVDRGDAVARSGDENFRNALCEQISKRVEDVTLKAGEALAITFEDASLVSISLRSEHYSGPEAFTAHGFGDLTIVQRIDD